MTGRKGQEMRTYVVGVLLLLRYRGSIRLFGAPVKTQWGASAKKVSKHHTKWGKLSRMSQNSYTLWGIRKEGRR